MKAQNDAIQILMDNANSFKERREILALTEAEINNVNNNMVSKLFKSAIDKAYVDFDDIPESKGDITKYKGYKTMADTLALIRGIAQKSNIKLEQLDIVEKSISNIIAYRDAFEKGFKLNKEFIILQYNTLVAMCVESTTVILSSLIDYVKRVDKLEFEVINSKINIGSMCIDNLDKFNKSVSGGDFSKVINGVIKSNSEGFVGTAAVTVASVIAGSILLVNIIREGIFFFYNSRVKLADFLKTQALFLELNRNTLEANAAGLPAAKKNEIIKKQEKLMKQLRTLADKVQVNSDMAEAKAKADIKKENTGWKLDDVRSDAVQTDTTGFQLL